MKSMVGFKAVTAIPVTSGFNKSVDVRMWD